ncbi:hypothetical protein CMUS01_14587 [Colletotrichum musicola]|uniref:Uncharacterized protein n=1 Tax=Colletotrichum musicola TaxID=2175873 RepID=A0A8H6J334_9PEZI|nr:hypothetical protein CMUS01_14587 [Colletotrichum musicola]
MSQYEPREEPKKSTIPAKASALAQKYSWTRQPFHTNQKQNEAIELAVALFKVDYHDILLTSLEKRLVLSQLTGKLSATEMKSRGGIANNHWVNLARSMCQGDVGFESINMYGALLRYQLKPPDNWYSSKQMRQSLGVLKYPQRCANGLDIYTKERMRNSPIADLHVGMEKKTSKEASMSCSGGQQTSQNKTASNEQPPSVDAKKRSPTTPKRFTRSTTNIDSSIKLSDPFALLSVKSSIPRQIPTTPTPASKKTILKTAPTSQKKPQQGSPSVKSAPLRVKADKKRKRSAECLEQNKSVTLHPAATSHQTKRARVDFFSTVGSGWIGSVIDAASLLDRIALFDAQDVRKLALEGLVEALGAAGWADLKHSVEQIIKDVDYESLVFLANMVVTAIYDRINLAVNNSSTEA